MYELSVIGVSLLYFGASVDYVRHAWKRTTDPSLATWFLMAVVMALSFTMYRYSPRYTTTGNIALTSGLINTVIILIGVLARHVRDNTLHLAFDTTQKWCLAAGVAVRVLYHFAHDPLTAYILVQCIAIIAYIATVRRLWNARRSTEPYFNWICVMAACVLAIYPAWVEPNEYSVIYLVRAIPSTLLVIYLIRRAKKRMMVDLELTPVIEKAKKDNEEKLPNYVRCLITSDDGVLLNGFVNLSERAQQQNVPEGFMTELNELNALYSLVTQRIWDAEHAPTGTSEEKKKWYLVSEVEEMIATILLITTTEGRIARRGAVRAALKAGERERAERLCQQYSNEVAIDSPLHAELEAIMR